MISGERDIEILFLPFRTVRTTSAPSAERMTPPPLITIAASSRRISEGSSLEGRMKMRREARIPMGGRGSDGLGGGKEARAHPFRGGIVQASVSTISTKKRKIVSSQGPRETSQVISKRSEIFSSVGSQGKEPAKSRPFPPSQRPAQRSYRWTSS